MSKKILISLHDVTPYHLPRLQKAEQFLTQWGVPKISYLFIPDYHRKNHQLDQVILTAFKQWTAENRAFALQWLLHGYYHLENSKYNHKSKKLSLPIGKRLKGKLFTAREGEFLTLSPPEIQTRINEGKTAFTNFFQFSPGVFVAPAWLFNEHLFPILKDHRFRISEDHFFIYLLQENQKIPAPVITWATRTRLRKLISQIGCPILNRWWSGKNLVRIALHPYDFHHPATINSIEKVIKNALNKREPILYSEL
ncbi:MAG: polysaccharide deacetylase family protein [Candidatus Aminicenantes bacterium]|jgi:predicted deacetylase